MEPLNVILLRKNLESEMEDTEAWIPSIHTHWLILGHFDEMYLYSLSQTNNFLNRIYEDKNRIFPHNNGSVYYHPLYLVPSGRENLPDNYDQIAFSAIVRIHFALTENFFEQFESLANAIVQNFEAQFLPYRIYYATEFSDMVLDVRSENLKTLLELVLKLRKNPQIGKMYTYFGINTSFVEDSERMPDKEDKIPMLSMRFSGTDLNVVKDQIKTAKSILGSDPEYSVNGIDDALLHYKDLETSKLVELYRRLVCQGNYSKLRQSESTTRVGIQINIQDEFGDPEYSKMPSFCKELIPLRDSVSELGGKSLQWFPAISEVVNSLVRMSRNPVMDEIVYLLEPSVEAFLRNVQLLLKSDRERVQANAEIYYNFVDNCVYLLEQLMRIEGQLSQRPEMRPVICDIPVFMLEYILAFLNKTSNLLQKNDDSPNFRFVFLLVPRPCERISTTELFAAGNDCPGLVQLEIPEKTLYSTDQILKQLCHEISHYVGEKYRMREERKEHYARAMATVLAENIFRTKSHSVEKILEGRLQKSLDQLPKPTIKSMSQQVWKTANTLFRSEEKMMQFFREYFQESEKITPISFPSDDAIVRGLHQFELRFNDLNILFREVYADICMLHILDVQTGDYIESLLLGLEGLELHPKKRKNTIDVYAIRIFVALNAMNRQNEFSEVHDSNLWPEIHEKIKHITKQIEILKDGSELHYPISAVSALLDYAKECYQTIKRMLPSTDTEEVRQMYDKLYGEQPYISILTAITECRTEMLKPEKQETAI